MGARHILAAVTLTATLTGCIFSVGPFAFGTSNARGGQPLPASPAHGATYLNPDDGMEIVFDGEKGLYRVPGLPRAYYFEGVYFRREATGWVQSTHLDGPWRPTKTGDLPPGLS